MNDEGVSPEEDKRHNELCQSIVSAFGESSAPHVLQALVSVTARLCISQAEPGHTPQEICLVVVQDLIDEFHFQMKSFPKNEVVPDGG